MMQHLRSVRARRVPMITVPLLTVPLLLSACAHLAAQTPNPVLTPTTLTFSAATGASPAAQTLSLSSSGSAFNYTASAISSGNWLSVTPASGSTPGTLTVNVNSQSLNAGTYGGFIQVTGTANAMTTIPVTLNVTASGLMSLTPMPSSLTFDFAAGAMSPLSRDIMLSTAGMQTGPLAVTVTKSNPLLNLTVSPMSPQISPNNPATVSVTVDPAGAPVGRHYATISFGAPGTGGAAVLATVNVMEGMGAATITSTPAQLQISGQLGSSTPVSQSLQITASGASPVSFTVTSAASSCGSGWLSVSPTSGTTPATLTVQANAGALPAGTCQGTISLMAAGASMPVTIPVSFSVASGSTLILPTTRPSFSFQIGGAMPAMQSISIGSSGAALPLNVSVTGTPAFLTVTPTSATTPATLQLSVGNLAGLAAGTYTNTISFASSGASNSPQSLPVTLVVSEAGMGMQQSFNASPTNASFVFQVGQSTPAAQTLQISSAGIPLRYNVSSTITTCPGFFTVSPQSGSTADFDSQGRIQPGQITITPVTTNITSASNCAGTVTLTPEGGSGTPLVIPITLRSVTTNTLSATPAAITAVAVAGTPTPNTQTIAVSSSTAGVPISFTATVVTDPPAQTWLTVTPSSSQTPANLTVNLNQSGLLPGVYSGSIRLSTGASTPDQTIPVRFTVVGTLLSPAPATITFSQAVGEAAPASQVINLGVLPSGAMVNATSTALNGSGWLTVTSQPNQNFITVGVSSSGLTEGIYRGIVTVTVPGASPSPLYIPVTFTYGTPSALSAAPTSLTFNYTAGSTTTPAAQTLQVTTTGTAVPFTAAVTSTSGGNFFTVTPTTGNTPGAITVSLNQAVIANLTAGTYTGSIRLSSSVSAGVQTIPVTLTVAAGPAVGTPALTSIVNLGSNQAGAAPGSIITLLGSALGPTTPASIQLTSSGLVQTTLADTTVTIDGIPAPLLLVSGSQINAIVPYEVAGKTSVPVVVRRTVSGTTVTSATTTLNIAPTAPAILTLDLSGSGQGAILNQNGTVNGASNPAAQGSIIVVYATGEGVLNPAVATGSITSASGTNFPQPAGSVTASVGGQPAAILYAGSAPGLIAGLMQVNLRLPASLPSGPQPVVLNVGGVSSRSGVTVVVQ